MSVNHGPEPPRNEDDLTHRDRTEFSDKEGFALGVLHTVSAAGAFGIVNQIAAIQAIAGPIAPLASITMLALALALSVLAAVYRYELHKHAIPARAFAKNKETLDAAEFERWEEVYRQGLRTFKRMQTLIGAATTLIVGSLGLLIAAIWLKFFGVL